MKLRRTYLALFLAFCLAVTAQAAVAPRGQEAGEQAILCTGAGVVVVDLDAEGFPKGSPHHCPECCLHLLVVVVGFVPLVYPLKAVRPLSRVVTPQVEGAVPVVHVLWARAPPHRA
ncbi:MAG: hypothetical protein MJH10_04035 [Epibacterium sp.]|nr:hypothetical protein [Epibacterium sp.]NQX72722.1 hypothetical protein [Epibacterium sp.]